MTAGVLTRESASEFTSFSLVEIAATTAPWLPTQAVHKLEALLWAIYPEASLAIRVHGLVAIAGWLGAGAAPSGFPRIGAAPRTVEGAGARLSALIELLRRAPQWRDRLSDAVRSVLSEANSVPFFADTGLATDHGFTSEAILRLSRRVLPSAPDDRDLGELVGRMLPTKRAGDWFESLPAESLSGLVELFGADAWEPIRAAMSGALTVLTVRVSSLGLHREMRGRGADGRNQQHSSESCGYVPSPVG